MFFSLKKCVVETNEAFYLFIYFEKTICCHKLCPHYSSKEAFFNHCSSFGQGASFRNEKTRFLRHFCVSTPPGENWDEGTLEWIFYSSCWTFRRNFFMVRHHEMEREGKEVAQDRRIGSSHLFLFLL